MYFLELDAMQDAGWCIAGQVAKVFGRATLHDED